MRPNVLIVTTHDSGCHFGCYGVPTVQTPNIDALAKDGVLFEQMFAPAPICSPSRGGLLSGQYPLANGLVGIAGGMWQWELDEPRRHLSWMLREAGYHTALIGLQHETATIESLGFEDLTRFGVGGGTDAGGLVPGWPDGKGSLSAVDVGERTAAFLREAANLKRPFFAQVGFFETHTPYDFAGCEPDDTRGVWVPPYADRYEVKAWASRLNRFVDDPVFARDHLARLQGSLKMTDDGVGRIMAALRETGLEENTIVLFNADHGVELPGAKWTVYDPGLGVACILRWPNGGARGGRRCPWLLSNVDVVPTLLELLGLESADEVQGRSFAAAVHGDTTGTPSPRTVVFGHWVDGLNYAARTERCKLIRNLFPEIESTGRAKPPYELYDLANDPLERVNLAGKCDVADLEAQMKDRLTEWMVAMGDPAVDNVVQGRDLQQAVQHWRGLYEQRR